jgi:hypothetical protein
MWRIIHEECHLFYDEEVESLDLIQLCGGKIMICGGKKKLEKNGDANASLITTTQKKKKRSLWRHLQKKKARSHFVGNDISSSIEVW